MDVVLRPNTTRTHANVASTSPSCSSSLGSDTRIRTYQVLFRVLAREVELERDIAQRQEESRGRHDHQNCQRSRRHVTSPSLPLSLPPLPSPPLPPSIDRSIFATMRSRMTLGLAALGPNRQSAASITAPRGVWRETPLSGETRPILGLKDVISGNAGFILGSLDVSPGNWDICLGDSGVIFGGLYCGSGLRCDRRQEPGTGNCGLEVESESAREKVCQSTLDWLFCWLYNRRSMQIDHRPSQPKMAGRTLAGLFLSESTA